MVAVKRSQLPEFDGYASGGDDDPYLDGDDDVFLGFSRVFSGILRPDSVCGGTVCCAPTAWCAVLTCRHAVLARS